MTPSDAELLALLPGATAIRRRPYAYATSCLLTEIEVAGRPRLLLKHLHARRDYDPRREVAVYRDVLAGAGVGPRLHGSGDDWLLLELIDGVELWQVGEVTRWEAVAAWLGRHHRRFAAAPPAGVPVLDATTLLGWVERAAPFAGDLDLARCRTHLTVLAERPRTLVHGEFYPSNVLLTGERVVPVDWETAALGPGVLDLAALVTGWDDAVARRLVAAYGEADAADLDRARLALALRWLGWTGEWTPPAEHRHDWLAEARAAADRLA